MNAPHEGPDRRRWIRQAAVLVGGAVASIGTTPAAADARAAAGQSPGTPVRVATPDTVVETTSGKVRGFRRNGVSIFRGIPYGESTAGAARFRPPQKPKPWT